MLSHWHTSYWLSLHYIASHFFLFFLIYLYNHCSTLCFFACLFIYCLIVRILVKWCLVTNQNAILTDRPWGDFTEQISLLIFQCCSVTKNNNMFIFGSFSGTQCDIHYQSSEQHVFSTSCLPIINYPLLLIKNNLSRQARLIS